MKIDPITGHTRTMMSGDGVKGRLSAVSFLYISFLVMMASPERYRRDILWCAASLRASTMDPNADSEDCRCRLDNLVYVFVGVSGDPSSSGLSTRLLAEGKCLNFLMLNYFYRSPCRLSFVGSFGG